MKKTTAIFLGAYFAVLSAAGAAETAYEIVKISPAKVQCSYEKAGSKAQIKTVELQDCWAELTETATKKSVKVYLEPAKCQGKKGESISLELVQHKCEEGKFTQLKCVRTADKKFLVERLIDQSFETKICNSGVKEAWLESSFAKRDEVKY